MKLQIGLWILLIATLLSAATTDEQKYEGCATSKKEAVYILSGNIHSQVSTSVYEGVKVHNDEVTKDVSTHSSAKSNLSLVNITYVKKKDEVCAVVLKKDQVENTQALLKQALLYSEVNLPKDVDTKIETLTVWLENIEQLGHLMPVFLKESAKEQIVLNAKEKRFKDIYAESIAYSDSLFFRSCEKDRESAEEKLNKKLFTVKKSKKDEGMFSSLVHFFSSDDSFNMMKILESELLYAKKGKQECVMFKKADLLKISQNIEATLVRFSQKRLNKNPKKRYVEIEVYEEQYEIAKRLFKLFPENYHSKNFNFLEELKNQLVEIKKTTYPQSVVFNVSGGSDISILLDGKVIKNMQKYYIKHGPHKYTISAKGKCPLSSEFVNTLSKDEEISESLEERDYPTVIFISNYEPTITLDGKLIKPNVTTSIKKCTGEIYYIAKYAGQTQNKSFILKPDTKETIPLTFLTPQELEVVRDMKVKTFTVKSEIPFSESLTPIYSEVLKFKVDDSTQNGSLEINEQGSFKYTSNKGYSGVDSFSYYIEGKEKKSPSKIVNIIVKKAEKVELKEPKKENVKAQNVAVKEEVKQEPKQEVQKESVKASKAEEKNSYENFKKYVESKELNMELMQKIQKRFPNYFERMRDEKLHK